MNDNENKAVKLCVASMVFMLFMWVFFGVKHHNDNYNYQPITEYNTIPEYSGL